MVAKLKNEQVIPILEALLGWWNNKQLPIHFQRQLIKARNKLQAEAEIIEELRQRLIDKYAQTDAEGKRVTAAEGFIKLTDTVAYNNEYKELMAGEITCPAISLEDFEALFDKLEPSVGQFAAMLGDEEGGYTILLSTKAPDPVVEPLPAE